MNVNVSEVSEVQFHDSGVFWKEQGSVAPSACTVVQLHLLSREHLMAIPPDIIIMLFFD